MIELAKVKGVTPDLAERLASEGIVSSRALADVHVEKMARKLGVLREKMQMIVEEAKRRCEALEACKAAVAQDAAEDVSEDAR